MTGPIPAQAQTSVVEVWRRDIGGFVRESSPAFAVLDGTPSIIVGSHDGRVYGIKASDGSDTPGWPRQTSHAINSSASLADVDGDGRQEVFIGSGTTSSGGALYSFDAAGNQRFRLELRDHVWLNPGIHSTPAIGDINIDNSADVVVGSLGITSIWATDHRGVVQGGFPYYADDTVFSSAALADLDGDGVTDFVIGADSTAGPPVDWRGGYVVAITGTGRVLWRYFVSDIVHSSPAVADLDGDGRPEIVFGTGNYWDTNGFPNADSRRVYVLNWNGTLRWVRDTDGHTRPSPALADLNGDGALDIVIGNGAGSVWAWDRNGNVLSGFGGRPSANTTRDAVIGSVVTADLTGDGAQDVLVPTGSGVHTYNGKNGNYLFSIGNVLNASAFQSSPLITDSDGDGKLDIFIAGGRNPNGGVVFRYELTSNHGLGNKPWPMWRKDARRTGSGTNPPLAQSFCSGAPKEGYWLAARDGGIFAFCDAAFKGSTGAIKLNQPIVGMAPTKSGNGYWLVASDGGIFSFGDAVFHGSTGAIRLNQPIVGMAPTQSGNGYWLVASDGGIFSFGDAKFFGSTGALKLNQPIVGMAPTKSGNGYWLVASDGGMFSFGDANFFGSTGGTKLNLPIVGMTPTKSGNGYWLVASDGGIFSFGDANFFGSTGAIKLNQPIVGMAATSTGGGYWLVASDGGIFAFGDARFFGSTGAIKLNQPIVGMAAPA